MPTPSTSDLPKPRDWDEFEDIVWDIFMRKWNDPKAKRYGRSGQRQHGVDIYGQPEDLSGAYVGVQCKRYAKGKFKIETLNAEIEKAEEFEQPLAEFIIATTDKRDVGLQDEVTRINKHRKQARDFSIDIMFWEDLVHEITKPDNVDLLKHHFRSWYDVFREQDSQRLSEDQTNVTQIINGDGNIFSGTGVVSVNKES